MRFRVFLLLLSVLGLAADWAEAQAVFIELVVPEFRGAGDSADQADEVQGNGRGPHAGPPTIAMSRVASGHTTSAQTPPPPSATAA